MAEKKIKTPEELRAEGVGTAGTAAAANSLTGTSVNKTEMVDNPNKLNLTAATDLGGANKNLANMTNALNNHSATKPGAYQDGFGEKLNGLYEQIQNGGKFNFDLNSDVLYNQYKDMYTKQGRLASEDVAGQVSALTGGYGNSYAATASNQAYQQYLNQLNDRALDIYDRRYNEFQDSRNDLYNQYNLLTNERSFDYNRYRDDVSDYYTEGDRLYNLYNNAQNAAGDWRDYEYGVERDKVADDQWQKNYDRSAYEYDTNLAWQKQEAAREQSNLDREFKYNSQVDSLNSQIAALTNERDSYMNALNEKQQAEDYEKQARVKIKQLSGSKDSMYSTAVGLALDDNAIPTYETFSDMNYRLKNWNKNMNSKYPVSESGYKLFLQDILNAQWQFSH